MTYKPTDDDIASILTAALVITEEATELRRCHTGASIGTWPEGEEEVKETYDEWMRLAYALEEIAERMMA